jgi:hypothetical protein
VHGSVSQKSVTLVNVPDQAKLGMQAAPSNDSQMFLGIPCPFHLEVGGFNLFEVLVGQGQRQ